MSNTTEHFVPALGRDWLTPLYDVFARLVGEHQRYGYVLCGASLVRIAHLVDDGAVARLRKKTARNRAIGQAGRARIWNAAGQQQA